MENRLQQLRQVNARLIEFLFDVGIRGPFKGSVSLCRAVKLGFPFNMVDANRRQKSPQITLLAPEDLASIGFLKEGLKRSLHHIIRIQFRHQMIADS